MSKDVRRCQRAKRRRERQKLKVERQSPVWRLQIRRARLRKKELYFASIPIEPVSIQSKKPLGRQKSLKGRAFVRLLADRASL